jgi:hypothetical protein
MSPKYDTGAKPPRRKQRPSIGSVAKQAAKAGLVITGIEHHSDGTLTYLTGKSGPDIGGKAKNLSAVQPYIEAAEQKRLAAAAHAKRLPRDKKLTPMVSHFQNRWSHISEVAPAPRRPVGDQGPAQRRQIGGCGDSFMMVTNGGAHGSSRPNPPFRHAASLRCSKRLSVDAPRRGAVQVRRFGAAACGAARMGVLRFSDLKEPQRAPYRSNPAREVLRCNGPWTVERF